MTFAPNLNKFIGLCKDETGSFVSTDSYSEQIHGGQIKPTPLGVPLCWTQGTYTVDELRQSSTDEDHELAERLQMAGKTEWCSENG